jgi:uroporphyrinogen decarboxylase
MEMTTKERFTRMYEHKEADRVPIIDSPWAGTIKRWKREGMPEGADWRDFFGVDKVETISVNISPNYPRRVLEETDSYIIATSLWGVTMKEFKEDDSTPAFLDYKVNTPEAWLEAKKRMAFDDSRIDWKRLELNYDKWRADGRWIQAGFWFGFDVTHSWMAGTETLLIALLQEPEWARDMFDTYLDSCIACFDRIWEAGYRFDCISWPDDMGYKGTPFFSTKLYRELLKPVHARAVKWAHEKGIKAHLHS